MVVSGLILSAASLADIGVDVVLRAAAGAGRHVGSLGDHVAAVDPSTGLSAVDPAPVTVTVTAPPAPADDSDGSGIELSEDMSFGAITLAILIGLAAGVLVNFGPGLWVFLGVLSSFLVTRAITRFIRRRGASGQAASGPVKDIVIGGVHVHHQVFGIVTMFLTGLVAVVTTPGDGWPSAVLALLFGIGVGLAFDEFALWVHLDDVYWSEQGRKSIDAVAVVLVIAASARVIIDFTLIGKDFDQGGDDVRWLWLLVAVVVGPALICLLKGKWITAALGFLYPPLVWIGCLRLAKERSWWSRHLYGARRRARAQVRHDGHERRMDRLRDLVGGSITPATALSETVQEAIHRGTSRSSDGAPGDRV